MKLHEPTVCRARASQCWCATVLLVGSLLRMRPPCSSPIRLHVRVLLVHIHIYTHTYNFPLLIKSGTIGMNWFKLSPLGNDYYSIQHINDANSNNSHTQTQIHLHLSSILSQSQRYIKIHSQRTYSIQLNWINMFDENNYSCINLLHLNPIYWYWEGVEIVFFVSLFVLVGCYIWHLFN